MFNKKGQAAMEFLMTYGWAILVVLAAIGALAYFGVLSPDRFLPEKCTMPSGIACLDFTQSGTAMNLRLQNAAGFDMSNISVSVVATAGSCAYSEGATSLANGAASTYVLNCTGMPAVGQKFKGTVTMSYINAGTSLPHSAVGEVILKIA